MQRPSIEDSHSRQPGVIRVFTYWPRPVTYTALRRTTVVREGIFRRPIDRTITLFKQERNEVPPTNNPVSSRTTLLRRPVDLAADKCRGRQAGHLAESRRERARLYET